MTGSSSVPPIALTMGEPAGIGPDVTLLAWRQRGAFDLPAFYCLADPDLLRQRASLMGIDVPIESADAASAARVFADAVPVVPLNGKVAAIPGQPEKADAALVIQSIDQAVSDVFARRAAAVVTNPINKAVLKAVGFAYPGHTEYLAELARRHTGTAATPVMMLAGPELRTVPVTIHIPLADVPAALSTEAILRKARIVARELAMRFGIDRPRLALSGLNPHAGENGTMGDEDERVIRPAVEALRAEGIAATGPMPADTMFHANARETYDVAICTYHDQALIPAKTLAFDEAVNVTLGLPFIRTSPDHGTAFAIAGTGAARPGSLIAALRMARQMALAERAR